MPLTEPKLDDRTFEDIYRELRLRIPRYAPQWTDFNESDPGTTLLQLFAWMGDMLLFRINQIPAKNYIRFLKLLGEELRPAFPARAHLTFLTKADTKAEPVPERSQIAAAVPGGEPVVFETEQGLDLIQTPLKAVGVFDGAAFENVTEANDKPGTSFRPLGWIPDAGSALYLGFEEPQGDTNRHAFPQRMVFRVFLTPEATAGKPVRSGEAVAAPPAPVVLVWEYRPREGAGWERLNVLDDESRAFTREGYINVGGPEEIEPSVVAQLDPVKRYWIRARVDSGRYPGGTGPVIDFVRTNTVSAIHLSTMRGEILGDSTGRSDQLLEIRRKPVYRQSLQLETEQEGRIEKWERKEDLLNSGPLDPHYTLNPTSGIVRFGDGKRGRIPEAGAQVIAREYRFGGGARGNEAGPGTIKTPRTVLVGIDKVTNERAAAGGAEEQKPEDLEREAPGILKRRGRAVTADDFASLALEIGGVKRAHAMPGSHPEFPGTDVPGAVTVVIVPDSADQPPKPSAALLEAVSRYLEQFRLITTEVHVTGPRYHRVRIEARVAANPRAAFDAASIEVQKNIDEFLSPKAWDFGQDLFPVRLYNEILKVKDVVSVSSLSVYFDDRKQPDLEQITLTGDELVYGAGHLIVVEPARDR